MTKTPEEILLSRDEHLKVYYEVIKQISETLEKEFKGSCNMVNVTVDRIKACQLFPALHAYFLRHRWEIVEMDTRSYSEIVYSVFPVKTKIPIDNEAEK